MALLIFMLALTVRSTAKSSSDPLLHVPPALPYSESPTCTNISTSGTGQGGFLIKL